MEAPDNNSKMEAPDLKRQLSDEGKRAFAEAMHQEEDTTNRFLVHVLTMNGDVYEVETSEQTSVEAFKKEVKKVSGVPEDCQQLFAPCSGTEGSLEDSACLQDYGVCAGEDEISELFLMVEPGFGFDPENTHSEITISSDCSSISKRFNSVAAARFGKPFKKGTSVVNLQFNDGIAIRPDVESTSPIGIAILTMAEVPDQQEKAFPRCVDYSQASNDACTIAFSQSTGKASFSPPLSKEFQNHNKRSKQPKECVKDLKSGAIFSLTVEMIDQGCDKVRKLVAAEMESKKVRTAAGKKGEAAADNLIRDMANLNISDGRLLCIVSAQVVPQPGSAPTNLGTVILDGEKFKPGEVYLAASLYHSGHSLTVVDTTLHV